MTAAVILLWASCLWSIARGVCCLILTASSWRRLAVLAVLAFAASCAHRPQENRRPPA